MIYWNFLPPEELNELLSLYKSVTHKTLQISKTFGIEGRKLLRPDDDYEALRDFNESYEGQTTVEEEMRLELQRLLDATPGLAERIAALPGRIFSGKEHPTPGTKAVFFCYRLPRPDYSPIAEKRAGTAEPRICPGPRKPGKPAGICTTSKNKPFSKRLPTLWRRFAPRPKRRGAAHRASHALRNPQQDRKAHQEHVPQADAGPVT